MAVGAPVYPEDPVNKMYVDTALHGFAMKAPVCAASVASVNLADVIPGYVVDSVTLLGGDRMLLKGLPDRAGALRGRRTSDDLGSPHVGRPLLQHLHDGIVTLEHNQGGVPQQCWSLWGSTLELVK